MVKNSTTNRCSSNIIITYIDKTTTETNKINQLCHYDPETQAKKNDSPILTQ